MNMSVGNPDVTSETLQRFSERSEVLRLHAQAHARAILMGLRAPKSDWPSFQEGLDAQLYYAAHYQIWKALQLLEARQHEETAKEGLAKGAEALEFLYHDLGSDPIVRDEELYKAALAYYISGHSARSYVLMKEVTDSLENLPKHLELVDAILKKDFKNARAITLETFIKCSSPDQTITEELVKGALEEDEAISRILYYSICKAVSFYLEYVKTGDRQLFARSFRTINDCVSVARDSHFVDWWWWSFCLRFLFEEYSKASLWSHLESFADNDDTARMLKHYVRSGLRQVPPIIELWPSQICALPMINDTSRRSFCLKMPTSAGKTRIAEFTILRFFLDSLTDPNKKCAYIAPFRSLAVEIEKTLRKNLNSLAIRVSEIYGGFELTPVDRTLIRETQVLVATPEKFDAFLRYMPEIEEDIGLIIIDEGHIVDPNERGLRFEFFLQRLLQRYKGKNCRFLFISAVLPNAKEFATWITGSPEQLVQSEWRPSRLMLGKLSWDGRRARIDYTHLGHRAFGQDCFVPRFIEVRECKGIPGIRGRRNPFPRDAREAFALAALLFAREGTTLVFVPQQRQAEPFGKALLETLRIQKTLAQTRGEVFEISYSLEAEKAQQRCKRVIEAEMGDDSPLLDFLNSGFLIHHAGLPQRVRVAIEDLVRSEGVRLIVATTTLAQGVNLPIKTVLVRGLYRGHNDIVDPLQFWNICGRAGRAGKENEGQILFCIDTTLPGKQTLRYKRAMTQVLNKLEQSAVISATRLLLQLIMSKWRESYPKVDVSELCIHLANNSYDWVPEESREDIHNWIDILDGHLLSLSEEFDIDPSIPDRLQQVLEGSLLFIQLLNDPTATISTDVALEILRSRISFIRTRHPQPSVRKRLYKLGMSLSDCETIETNKEHLYKLFKEALSWDNWSNKRRFDLLLRISEFVLSLSEVGLKDVPEQWPRILLLWLEGISVVKMAEDNEIKTFARDPTKLSLFLENVCGYRLPWGINSILYYLAILSEERKETLPPICSYFSGMFKYGVNNPIAVCILPFLDRTRDLALISADICPHNIEQPEKIAGWFKDLTEKDLIKNGIRDSIARRIISVRDSFLAFGFERGTEGRSNEIKVIASHREAIRHLRVGNRVLVVPHSKLSDRHYQIFTLDGEDLGIYRRLRNPVPKWWADFNLVDSFITDIQEQNDRRYRLSIRLEEL
jgi:replicative superfamily II helicase